MSFRSVVTAIVLAVMVIQSAICAPQEDQSGVEIAPPVLQAREAKLFETTKEVQPGRVATHSTCQTRRINQAYNRVDLKLSKEDKWRPGYKNRYRKELEQIIAGYCKLGKPGQAPNKHPFFAHNLDPNVFLTFDTTDDADCALEALRCAGGPDAGVPLQCTQERTVYDS